MIACQACRYGLIHWHCPDCGTEVQEPARYCTRCRNPAHHWLGMAAVVAAIASWYFALTALHDYLMGGG